MMSQGVTVEYSASLTPPSPRKADRPAKAAVPKGRIPRLSRYMALAIRFEELFQSGIKRTDVSEWCHISLSRMTQITNLLILAPDIQEEILFLPRTVRRCVVNEYKLRRMRTLVWSEQRWRWAELKRSVGITEQTDDATPNEEVADTSKPAEATPADQRALCDSPQCGTSSIDTPSRSLTHGDEVQEV
jgi:hypothetical protein